MQSPDPSLPRHGTTAAGTQLSRYLHTQAADFLRSLRLHGEAGADTAGAAEAAQALRTAAGRIGGTLDTFRPLVDPAWADELRTELRWLSRTLALEHACAARLARLLDALSRLSGSSEVPRARAELLPGARPCPGDAPRVHAGDGPGGLPHPASGQPAGPGAGTGAPDGPAPPGGNRTGTRAAARTTGGGSVAVGAARAAALLERQLTLARTRAHSAALGALGSARFHAVADAVALLASELPLAPAATGPAADETLALLTEVAEHRLLDAVARLPLGRAGHPYNADALGGGLATEPDDERQDAPWHAVRRLLRLHRYAQEVAHPGAGPVLGPAALALDHHRDAAEASEAAAAAARTPRIAPATAYALGVLHADQRHEVEAARFAFQQEWRHARAAIPAP
ncbi:CHAD domain-containing protein [Streptomyces sp. NPDC047968]|uniref:CHAD domain-containing protein n=1 Tax=unclassified Streptomyces TaxID=2593676 RepID=UPI00343B724E